MMLTCDWKVQRIKLLQRKYGLNLWKRCIAENRLKPFIPPDGVNGVIVDIETGGLAVTECEKQRLVYVKEKDMPQKLCTDKSLQDKRKAE